MGLLNTLIFGSTRANFYTDSKLGFHDLGVCFYHRGLVYLDEVRGIHRMIIKKSRDIYENTIKDVPDMEEKDLIKIRHLSSRGTLFSSEHLLSKPESS